MHGPKYFFLSKNVTDIWKILPQYFKKYPKAACGMRPRRASCWLTCKQRETNHDTRFKVVWMPVVQMDFFSFFTLTKGGG